MLSEGLNIDSSFIYEKLKAIVSKQHSDFRKHNVKEKSNGQGFNFACPYCGDSDKKATNYRGNLNSSMKYKCFNCGTRSTFIKLCTDFEIYLDSEIRNKLYNYIDSKVKISNIDVYENADLEVENLLNVDEVFNVINKNPSIKLKDIQPLKFGTYQHFYVHQTRKFPTEICENIYQGIYMKGRYSEPVILFLNKKNGSKEMLSFQVRNLKDGDDRWFKVYSYKEIVDIMNFDVPEDTKFLLNKISFFFNILNVDFNSKITVLESYQDSVYYPNSIGAVGTNTDFTFFDVSDVSVQYFFDNDKTGHINSAKLLNKGKSVFLWNKLFDYIISLKKPIDPYVYKENLLRIKDLDKLNSFAKDAYNRFKLENFFSTDIYDIKYIPKYKPIRPTKTFYKSKKI